MEDKFTIQHRSSFHWMLRFTLRFTRYDKGRTPLLTSWNSFRQKSPMEKSCFGRVFTPFIPSETTRGLYRCGISTCGTLWLFNRLCCLVLNNPMSQVEKLVEVKWSALVAANRTKGSKTFNSAKIQHDDNITSFHSSASKQKYLWIKGFCWNFQMHLFCKCGKKDKEVADQAGAPGLWWLENSMIWSFL